MRRRDVVVIIGAAAIALPRPTGAKRLARMPVIGVLCYPPRKSYAGQLQAFYQGLSGQGFAEGKNIEIKYLWAEGDRSKLPALASELVRTGVAVIATVGGRRPAVAASEATTTIPIVTGVAPQFVSNLARPSGNVTGAGTRTAELTAKRLELLHQAVPRASLVAVLNDPTWHNAARIGKMVADAAGSLGLRLFTADARSSANFDNAFALVAGSGAGALLVMPNPFFFSEHRKIVALAARYRLPAMYEWGEIARDGGLMAYGDSVDALYRRIGDYTGRILKGAEPAELAVDQPAAIRLIVNMKTAKTIGFTFPPRFFARVDEVIE